MQWHKSCSGVILIWALVLGSALPAGAKQPVPDGQGAATLAQALQKLPVVASMLHIGAHPDDENSALVAYVSRALHARTAYLALNRGEGGQNLIGPELYDGIGIIRTEELLAARRFDGAEQYFTRAFDFGFSKQASEALELWGRDALLEDVVRVVRMFRPDVIVSVFSGTPRDGHGQHQAAGVMAREAFHAAADPNRFPEQIAAGLRPWQAKKLYISARRFPGSDRAIEMPPGLPPPATVISTLTLDTGEYSPILDRSYLELGLAGRSMHRSQDMGAIQRKGPAETSINLVDRDKSLQLPEGDRSLFDGIDTTILRLLEAANTDRGAQNALAFMRDQLPRIHNAAQAAIDAYRPFEPTTVIPHALEGLNALRTVRDRVASFDESVMPKDWMLFYLDRKEQDFVDVIRLALGLSFEALADAPVVIPESTFGVEMQLLNRSRMRITPERLYMSAPDGWKVDSRKTAFPPIGYNEAAQETVAVTVAREARFSRPYWRRASTNDARVTVDSDAPIGLPWRPPDVVGHAVFNIDGTTIEITRPVQYRYADPAFGEIRRELKVAPALSVTITPEVGVVPVAGPQYARPFQVTVRTNVQGAASGAVTLDLPDGWSSTPKEGTFSFTRPDQETTLAFEVTPPPTVTTGAYRITARATLNGRQYTQGYQVVSYPHIEPRHLYRDAVSEVNVFDMQIARNLHVGYIMGAGDDIPPALEQLGVRVEMLDEEDLATGDLRTYDVIVAGIRAYEVRRDLVALNHRLLEYVRQGGAYIVQYNKYEFNEEQYGPYPTRINRPHDRVTREEAPVTLLDPQHPMFNTPNKITDADFGGWVQERGLYFIGEWDPRYTPLMESNDPGEAPKRGGMLEARYGAGRYIYTGYAWFRQLPAGVAGAYRLFANMLSLPRVQVAQ